MKIWADKQKASIVESGVRITEGGTIFLVELTDMAEGEEG